ncbi:MAG: molecular chaperone DnaK, partial [Candidatus Nealsonbacteria bacterium CG_4_8_14_3_um_filter_39_7]
VVALGAAIQGGILQGDVKDILLLDVNPLSLGIETLGGVNTILIPKNTTVPTAKTQVFSTATDSQSSVEIHILQGERPMASDSKTLGRFILDGIPVAPRGIPQIEVTFDIDANGILNVSAHDKATNKKQSIRIEGSTGLSKEEIERMKKEAEMNVADDQKKRDLIQARNEADSLIYSVEKTLKDAGDKVPAEAKKEVEGKMEELKKIKDGDDLESIKTKIADLSQTIQKIGAELYKNTQAPGQQPSDQKPEDKKEDGPEEAETKKE